MFIRYDQTAFTDQLKRILQVMPAHKYVWNPEPVQVFPPDALMHTNKKLNHRTGKPLPDPYREATQYLVPDQEYSKLPIPEEFADAYWSREQEARRAQCPDKWMSDRKLEPWKYDVTDDSLRPKKVLSSEEVLANVRRVGW